METFGKLMTVVLAMIISPIINGFVFMKLWIWFIVPIFKAQPLRLIEAIGVLCLISFIGTKMDNEANKDEFWKDFTKKIVFVVLLAGFALLYGWIVSLFL